MKYRIADRFEVSAEHYWDTFLSPSFNEALWRALDIGLEPIAFERRGEGANLVIVREQRLTPRRELPKMMQKFVQGAFSYLERDVFTAATGAMEVTNTPSFLADKLTLRGVYRLETIEPQAVNRIWEGECECRLPLVGGAIEKSIVEEVKDSYRKTTEFTREWFRRETQHG